MKYVVNVPVCDLRREPHPHSNQYVKDPLQESQLLYGERLLVKEVQGAWAFVETLEQKKFSKEGEWIGYPGWVLTSQLLPVKEFPNENNLVVKAPWAKFGSLHLSFGTCLKGIRKDEKFWTIQLPDHSSCGIEADAVSEIAYKNSFAYSNRMDIMHHGALFLESPYLWGGRSAFKKESQQITSIDCSGLTNLLYRSQGIDIPRDAHDQRLQCREIEFEDLQIADFIFTAEIKRPERVSHVMLYKGDDILLEASLDAGKVRFITGREKLGKSLSKIKSGENVGNHLVWFGTLI